MSRIDSGKVNLGSSFVLSTSDADLRAQEIVSAKKIAAETVARAQAQAQQIIDEAKQQAAKYIEDANAKANGDVDEITEQARQEGFAKGYEEGHAQAQQDLIAQIENLDKFTASEFEIKKRIIKSAHNDIVNLIISISDKVCHKKLDIDPEVLCCIVKSAVNELKDKEAVTLIVNPNMAQKIYDISETLKNDILSLNSIKIIEDVSVSEDGAIVESISSRVDSRVSAQIDEIAQKLLVGLQSVAEDELVAETESGAQFEGGQNDESLEI